jgi:tetratricopeptide (TPR) repeat protein
MKKYLISLVLLLISGSIACAQAPAEESESTRKRNETDQRIYQLALRYNDVQVARGKLFELIERNPTSSRYMELLASLYFETNQYGSAALTAMDALELNDKSVVSLEVAAYSLEQIGALERALPYFERLFLLTDDVFSLYKTAYMQYSLKRYEEALNSINMLVKHSKSSEEKLGFAIDENNTQDVNLKAAGLNLRGLVYLDQGSKDDAKKAFQQALEVHPTFDLAKQNLKGL